METHAREDRQPSQPSFFNPIRPGGAHLRPLPPKDSNVLTISAIEAAQRAMLDRKTRAGKRSATPPQELIENSLHVPSNNTSTPELLNGSYDYDTVIKAADSLRQKRRNGKITPTEAQKLNRLEKELLLQNRLRDAAATTENNERMEASLFVQQESLKEAGQRHARTAPEIFHSTSEYHSSQEDDDINSMSTLQVTEHLEADRENASGGDTDAEPRDDGHLLPGQMDPTYPSSQEDGKKSRKKKSRRAPPKSSREYHERERQDRLNKERKRAQKYKSRKSLKSPTQSKNSKSAQCKKVDKDSLKINKEMRNMLHTMGVRGVDGEDNIARVFLSELNSVDHITDRLTNDIFNAGPEKQIFTRRKDKQFQKLLGDIPHGSSKKSATSDIEKLRRAALSFGSRMVQAIDGKWLVKGMKSPLLHHQLLGAQWMLSREFGVGKPPFGGLLADAMGLGKTVQTLACMVGNLPHDEDRKRGRGATLIIAPSSVINQWIDEIYVHANEAVFPKVLHYRAKSKISKTILESLDIVVTSYAEVMKQLPWPRDKEEMTQLKEVGAENWLQMVSGDAGVLHQVQWYRVVLDEAHAIKNYASRTSKACQNLKSLYKWCLTGTPLMNELEE